MVILDGDAAFVDHPFLSVTAQQTQGVLIRDNPLNGQIFSVHLVGALALHVNPAVGCLVVFVYVGGQLRYEVIQRGGQQQDLLVGDLHFFRPDFGVAARIGLETAATTVGKRAEKPLHGLSGTVIGGRVYRPHSQLIHQRHRIILAETAGTVILAVVEVHLIGHAVLLHAQAEALLYRCGVGVCVPDKEGYNPVGAGFI